MVTEINYFMETNFSEWMMLLSFQLTVLLMIIGCWFLYSRLPARRSWSLRPFMSRVLRRCRAIPDFFSYRLFEEIDDLKATVAKLNNDIDTEMARHAKIKK